MKAGLLGMYLVTLLALAAAQPATAGSEREPLPWPVWREEVLVGGVQLQTLNVPALALDRSYSPHIVYGNARLYHAWLEGDGWQSEVVDKTPITTRRSVLVIDGAGALRIADAVGERVTLRTRQADGSWAAELVPLPGRGVIEDLTLAADSGGGLHLVAVRATSFYTGTLVYARRAGETWSAETLDAPNPVGGPPAVALDSQERPVILYGQRDAPGHIDILWLMRRSGGGWQREQLATGYLIIGKALALSAGDEVHALYSDHHGGELIYVRRGPSGWQATQVTDYGVHPGLALDEEGRPHAVYGAEWGQAYAVLEGEQWQLASVQQAPYAGWYNTLILDQAGAAHIASLATNLHYATNASGAWRVYEVAANERIGAHNALALDGVATAQALYYAPGRGALMWGRGDGETWQSEQVAAAAEQALAMAIAVDGRDRPHIAYIDSAADALVAGTRRDGVWQLERIDAAGSLEGLVVAGDGREHLIGVQRGRLTYYRQAGGTWQSELVGGPNFDVSGAALALDENDWAHVAYSADGRSFYAVRQADGQWRLENLPFEQVVDLALADGSPTFLHSRASWAGNPKYPFYYVTLYFSERTNGAWEELALDSIEVLAWSDPIPWEGDAELAAAEDGRPQIALCTSYGHLLYVQRDEARQWQWEYPGGCDGHIGLALDADGQPRILYHEGASLVLGTREILLLGEAMLLPVVAR